MTEPTLDSLFPTVPAATPAWPGHPSQLQPGGRVIVRDNGHPCHGCPLEAEHNVWGRVTWEEGGYAAVADAYKVPGRAWLMRLQEILDKADWAMAPYPSLDNVTLSYPYDLDIITEAMPEILSGEIVGASGNTLTVRTTLNPLALDVQQFEANPDWPGPGQDRFLPKPIKSRLQPGDRIAIGNNSPLHRRVQPSVVAYVTAWGGPGSTYQIQCDQSVVNAHKRVVQSAGPVQFKVWRVYQRPHWPTLREPAPLYTVRHQIDVAWSDVAALPTPRRLELFDTAGGQCRVAIPRADGGAMEGTLRALRRRAGVSEDISAEMLSRVQFEHAPAGGYRTHLLLEEPTALLIEGDELRLWYNPEATGSETGEIRVPCQATCHHAHEHAGVSFCGLAGRTTTPTQSVPAAPDPPTGVANFRSVAAGGCYQSTCSDWLPRTPWSLYRSLAAYIQQAINGVGVRFDQAAAGSVQYSWVRPLSPDGVPGLRAALGTTHDPFLLPAIPIRQVIAAGAPCGRRGGGASSEIYRGAEYDDRDNRLDFSANERPREGLLKNEAQLTRDPLGREWDDTTDPTGGFRFGGSRLFGTGVTYGGVGGLLLGDMRQPARHRSTFKRVSLDREGLQTQAWGTAQVQADGSLLLSFSALRNGNRSVSVLGDPILAYAPTQLVSGTIASASDLGDGRLALELENELRVATLAGGAESFLSGGNFCKLPPYYLANDSGDAESRILGDNCRRGATPGYACRVLGLDPENADQLAAMGTGYIIDYAEPHGGSDGGWGDGPPSAGWPAKPANFDSWGNLRDRVVVFDRSDGVLNTVRASLVGATLTCEISGILSPVPREPLQLLAGPYQQAWTPIDPSAIELIDYWAGRIKLSADWVAAQTERVWCFDLQTDFFDDRCRPAAGIFTELKRWLTALFRVRLTDVTGAPGVFAGTISQEENPFEEGWCITAWDAKDAEGRPNYYTLITDPSTIDPAILTGPTNYCAPGFILENDAIQIDLSSVVTPPTSSSVQVQLQSGGGLAQMYPLFRSINVGFPASAEISAQVLARESWDSDSILRVVGSLAMDGISESRTTTTWTNATTQTTPPPVVTTGSATVRLALYGFKKRPDSSVPNRLAILATSEEVTISDGVAQDVDLTPLVKGYARHKTSEYSSFAVMAVPTDVVVEPDTTPEQATNNAMPDVVWTNYEPIYSGCSGLTPTPNPNLANRAGSYTSIDLFWSGFSISNIIALLQPRAAFGANETTPIDDAGGHTPPAA